MLVFIPRNRLRLLEMTQIPKEQHAEVTPRRFDTLNTNNVWVSLEKVQELLTRGVPTVADVVAVERTVNNVRVVQLQTASPASAIRHFSRPLVIKVGAHGCAMNAQHHIARFRHAIARAFPR